MLTDVILPLILSAHIIVAGIVANRYRPHQPQPEDLPDRPRFDDLGNDDPIGDHNMDQLLKAILYTLVQFLPLMALIFLLADGFKIALWGLLILLSSLIAPVDFYHKTKWYYRDEWQTL